MSREVFSVSGKGPQNYVMNLCLLTNVKIYDISKEMCIYPYLHTYTCICMYIHTLVDVHVYISRCM